MNASGWITMITSVSLVTALFAWCIWKVLRLPAVDERLHSSNDPTPDAQRED